RTVGEEKLGKWVAGLLAAVRVLWRSDPVDMAIDGRPVRVWSLFVGVNRNREGSVTPLRRMRLDDGMLDVRILHAGSRMRAVGSLVFGRRGGTFLRRLGLLRGAPTNESFAAGEISVVVSPRHDGTPGLAHDGEVWLVARGEGYAWRIRNIPGGLRVYSPSR
ncbi:MAG TPA: hypothetical protein VFT01_11340, partial [Homoserinimonas sp.]|nr:hypothetical protein [Homoserinimonas sp.]